MCIRRIPRNADDVAWKSNGTTENDSRASSYGIPAALYDSDFFFLDRSVYIYSIPAWGNRRVGERPETMSDCPGGSLIATLIPKGDK